MNFSHENVQAIPTNSQNNNISIDKHPENILSLGQYYFNLIQSKPKKKRNKKKSILKITKVHLKIMILKKTYDSERDLSS